MKKAYIHVGFPKTGTSTLQKYLFPNVQDLKFLGTNHFGKRIQLVHDIATLDDLSTKVYKQLKDTEKSVLLSDESLTPSQDYSDKQGDTLSKYKKIARNIKTVFDSHNYTPQIIFSVRRQDSMVLSQYSQFYPWYLRSNQTDSFDKYYQHFIGSEINSNLQETLDYFQFYKIYCSVFGEENVFTLVFEELALEPRIYYSKVFKILGIVDDKLLNNVLGKVANSKSNSKEARKVEGTSVLAILSIIKSRLMPRFKLSGFEGIKRKLSQLKVKDNKRQGISINLSHDEKIAILNVYKDSNNLLSKKLGLNLEKYGYFSSTAELEK